MEAMINHRRWRMEPLRLGELLVKGGVLTAKQVEDLLHYQLQSHKPIGWLAERKFGIDPEVIEDAWAEQYASITHTIDPEFEYYSDEATQLVSRRQAWQFRVLPIRFDGDELIVATTQRHLRRALRFATNVIGVPVYFVMTEPIALGRALNERFALEGFTAESIDDDATFAGLLEMTKNAKAA